MDSYPEIKVDHVNRGKGESGWFVLVRWAEGQPLHMLTRAEALQIAGDRENARQTDIDLRSKPDARSGTALGLLSKYGNAFGVTSPSPALA